MAGPTDKEIEKASAFAEAFPAVRSGQPLAATDDDADQDISRIQLGAKAITGKAVWSANSAARNADTATDERKHDKEKKDESELQEMRELAHLAQWNAQMTMVGGITMTNEEAQDARQHIIDNDDLYAHRAVMEGRIQAHEEEDYKFTIRRIKELEDRKGRGVATGDETKECEDLKRSRIGREAERDSAEYHVTSHGLTADAGNQRAQADKALNRDRSPDSKDVQTQIGLQENFQTAVAGAGPSPERPAPVLPGRDLKQTGINF